MVKYGNSSALVLDKTILSLLNINEDSLLKLKIEGDSLIIRAAENVKATDSMMKEIENIHDRIRPTSDSADPLIDMAEAKIRDFCKKAEADPSSMRALKEWSPGTENWEKLVGAYKKIMGKYQGELELLAGKNFREEVKMLTKKYQGESPSKALFEELLALRLRYAPKLAEMDKEMEKVNATFGYPDRVESN